MDTTPTLRIALLGPPVVEVDGAPLQVDTRKAVALLAYVALARGPVRRDTLTTLGWPDADADRARSALRRTLSTLRSALHGRWLVTDRETVGLDAEGLWIDVGELRRSLAACGAHVHPPETPCVDCTELLETAVALDRGPFLEGFGLRDSVEFDDWQQAVGRELAREVALALERLAAQRGSRGDHAGAITLARRRLALDPLHEPAHRMLIRALAGAGDRAGALEQYRACVRALDRELGVRPLDETTALYHAILEGAHDDSRSEPTPAPPRGVVTASHTLVGRDRELALLDEALAALGPEGSLLAVQGEAGIGKTRLCDELVVRARAAGAGVVAVRCFQDEAELAFGVVIELARAALDLVGDGTADSAWWRPEVARLLPELGPAPHDPLASVGSQARFYDAVCALVTERVGAAGRGVVVVDDVHWADEASLGLLAYLAHRLRGRPLLLVVAARPEELGPAHPAQRLLAAARRSEGASVVAPGRLSTAEVGELVARAGHDPALAAKLHRESGGLPFFVVEYLDALSRGEDPAGDWPLPAAVRDLLSGRLAALGELAGQVVAAAAVLGRSFEPETVRDTSGRADDETVAALEELVTRGLLAEAPDGTLDFRHEQVRELVHGEMTLARRRLLHRRAAVALAARGRREEHAAAIAHHLVGAGDDAAAAEAYRVAGDRARRLYANAEAAAHFRAALDLGHPDLTGLQLALGDLATLAGEYGAALTAYETAAANAEGVPLALIEHRLGLLHLRRGAWELAEAALAAAQARLPPEHAARLLADRSLAAHRRGDTSGAETLAREGLERAERSRDDAARAQAHNILGMLAASDGDHEGASAEMRRSLELARSAEDREAEAAAANNLALVLSRGGRRGANDEAIGLARAALDVCVELGDRHREAALRNNLADLLHRAGQEHESMAELKRAVAIFAEVGEEGRLEPEIWKLADW